MTSDTHDVVTVRPAVLADADHITRVLAAAFLDTPDGPWLVPNQAERRQIYQRYCTALVHYTLQYGRIDVTDTLDAAAVWFDHTHPPPSHARTEYERLRATACGAYTDRFRLLDDVFVSHYPRRPHHYLAWLGVHPSRQCQGLGSALLEHRHRQLDAAGLPAFLIATSSGARQLYGRHGYSPPKAPFFLPDGGPPMWPMRRGLSW
jgi:GNAT superfamily N-acetyltransferase